MEKKKKYNEFSKLIFEGEYLNYGKYIIYETNNKGKEYNSYNDELIFEGDYLNGERNGKGNEYYNNGKLKFEAQYVNGKKKWKRKRI